MPEVVDADLNIFAKSPDIVPQWNNRRLYPNLRKIVVEAAQLLREKGHPLVITSIYRTDGGIHNDWRAVDARCFLSAKDIAEKTPLFVAMESVRETLNERFPYGMRSDGTPGVTVPPFDHEAAQSVQPITAPHFHFQLSAANVG